jgi:hypothetical protein
MIEPVLAVRNRILSFLALPEPMVIVIDGLDECDDKELMAEFIEVVISACQDGSQFPFRLFFTSRMEEHLLKKLEAQAARSVIYRLALPDFEASNDIRTFFQSRFSTIYEENRRLMGDVPLPWPSQLDLEALVEKAAGSFLFAFTLVNFVNDGSDLPHRKLSIALGAHAGLDPLYTQVLSAGAHCHIFKRVLGTIMLLAYPVSIISLGHLLQLETADILRALLRIQSIVLIPEDDEQPVQLFHTSLRDFLTSQPRSGKFFIDPPICHTSIAIDCLKLMAVSLKRDSVFRGAVSEYVCGNWCHHLHQSLIERGNNFLNPSFKYSVLSCLTNFKS